MRLKLQELQKVVDKVVKEEKHVSSFCDEIVKSVGITVIATHGIKTLAESANDRLDVLERTGAFIRRPKPSALLPFMTSKEPEVRKLIARLLPESFLPKMMNDNCPSVRAIVANRLPLKFVNEMIMLRPQDEMLQEIEKKKIAEKGGLPDPEEAAPFDLYGDAKVGSQIDSDDLSDGDYNSMALSIIRKYDGNLERNWEEVAVDRYAKSVKSFGVEIDKDKLLKCVYSFLEDRDEKITESYFKKISSSLREESSLLESFSIDTPTFDRRLSPSSYIKKFEDLYDVKKIKSKNLGKKMLVSEGAEFISRPALATIPAGVGCEKCEKDVDTYVKNWNDQQTLKNSYNKLSWSYHPEMKNKIKFRLEVR